MGLGLRKKYFMSIVQSGGVSPRLPSAYQEVEWVASDGQAYFMSGINPTQNHGFEAKVMYNSFIDGNNQRDDRTICVSQDGSGRHWGFNTRNDNSYWQIENLNNTGKTEVPSMTLNTTYTIEYNTDNLSKCYIDGSHKATMTRNTYALPELPIMAFNNNGSIIFIMIGRLYYYKLYENGTLVRDFVPCYRIADGEIGLYDLVNDVFYTNQGSGTFTCGVPIIYDSRYQQVEYIAGGSTSSGAATQWIDTGYIPNTNTDFEIDFSSTRKDGYWFGCSKGFQNNAINLYCYADNTNGYSFGGVWKYNWTGISTGTRTKFSIENHIGKLNGTAVGGTTSGNNYTLSTSTTITLMCNNHATLGPRDGISGKIYNCRIWDNGTLVRNFIPVYRIADNEIGLLDIVNDVFYTNQGSSVFTKGSDIIVS